MYAVTREELEEKMLSASETTKRIRRKKPLMHTPNIVYSPVRKGHRGQRNTALLSELENFRLKKVRKKESVWSVISNSNYKEWT